MNHEMLALLRIMKRDMRSYDLLSQAARIHYVRHAISIIEPKHASHACAHGIMLYDECTKCERWDDKVVVCDDGVFHSVVTLVGDTRPYIQAAYFRIKELLRVIDEYDTKYPTS